MKKFLLALLFLSGFSLSSLANPIILGKDQAPINTHDYKILEEVAINAKIPVEKFRHLKRSNHFIVGPEGFLYRDRKKNGVIDNEDVAIFVSIVRADNSYITDEGGSVIGVSIDKSEFSDITILNKFKKIVAINLSDNQVADINLSDLPELRFLNIFEDNDYRTLTQIKNVNNLSYLFISGLNTPDFKKIIGVKSLRKIYILGMGIESFAGLENMPNIRDIKIIANGKTTAKNFKSLEGIPKGHKLEKLTLSSSVTTDIQGVSNFTQLKSLELWANKRALTDFTPISELKNLEELELTVLELKDFDFIDDMPKLKKIVTYHAPINSLTGLDEAPNLEVLKLTNGQLKAIENLENNTQLKSLILNTHKITRLKGLEKLTKLRVLDVSNNKIPKIEGLDNNLCLEKLWIAGNPIGTFENIYHLPLLHDMGIEETDIREFPHWKDLKHLGTLVVERDRLDKKHFTPGYFFGNVPIKEFDQQLMSMKPVTNEERKQHGCM
jgi:Leucine-rich repeat (LRR) protein